MKFPTFKRNRRFVLLLLGSLLALNLACGLTQGLDVLNSGEESVSTSEDDGSSTTSEDESAIIAEDSGQQAGQDETTSADEPADRAAGEGTAPESKPESSPRGNLAKEQIMIMPGREPPTLDPHLSGDAASAEYVVEIYSGLMAYDSDLNLIPDIAESFEVSDDGRVYTFFLRDDARFQDGKPITAQDFKWSFERACDPATGSHTADTYLGDIEGCRAKLQGEADEISGVKVLDDHTIEITIDEPKGFFLAKMTYPTAYVLDRENVESGPEWYLSPNGSGPFRVDTFAPEEGAIILDRNDNYYREPMPILERVIYVLGNPVNLMTGYVEGLDDLGLTGRYYDLIPIGTANMSQVTDPNNPLSQELQTSNSLSVFYIGFNVNEPPFDDPKVRQAFNLALDKARMIRLVSQGTLPVANGIVPPNMPGYENPDLSDFEFDPEQALQLISESSYGDVSELPEMTLNVSGDGSAVGPMVEAVIESFRDNLGADVNVEQTPWSEFLSELNNPNPAYQMYQLGWIADYPDPQNFLEVLFHSESAQNHGGYSNPEVDALLEQARGAQDTAERLALYQQAEQLILEDAAWIPLYFDVENTLVKPYVQGYTAPPIQIPRLQYVSILEH
jgi:oligopeptide transport system substrate-binding protein